MEGESYKVRNQRYGKKRGQEESRPQDSDEKKEMFPQDAGGVYVSILPLENEGTMGRIFKQLDYLIDKGEDIKHAVKKVVNHHKYKFDVLFEDTSDYE